MRLFLFGTPRTGNTWLRMLLSDLLQLPSQPVVNPARIDWASLPREILLSLHWPRTPELERQVRANDFRVVVLMRHPLDVLLSILHYATANRSPQKWLDGQEGDERSIHAAMPGSRAFRAYAAGHRARALMAVSRTWASCPGAQVVRYEDLVEDTTGQLTRLLAGLGAAPRRPVGEVIAKHQFGELRSRDHSSFHFWCGKPGTWRRLLVAEQAKAIAEPHADALAQFGYAVEPDVELDALEAERRWIEMAGHEWAEGLQSIRDWIIEVEKREADYAALFQKYDATLREKGRLEAKLAEVDPKAMEFAKGLMRLNEKEHWLAAPVKPILRWLYKRAA